MAELSHKLLFRECAFHERERKIFHRAQMCLLSSPTGTGHCLLQSLSLSRWDSGLHAVVVCFTETQNAKNIKVYHFVYPWCSIWSSQEQMWSIADCKQIPKKKCFVEVYTEHTERHNNSCRVLSRFFRSAPRRGEGTQHTEQCAKGYLGIWIVSPFKMQSISTVISALSYSFSAHVEMCLIEKKLLLEAFRRFFFLSSLCQHTAYPPARTWESARGGRQKI